MTLSASLNMRQTRALAMTPQLRRAIGLLQHNNVELAAYLDRELALNPFVEVRAAGLAETERVPPSPGPATRRDDGSSSNDIALQALPDAPEGLVEHLTRQIRLEIREAEQRRIALAFLEALEPHGWLGSTVVEVASACGCSAVEAEAVLARLQALDPSGIFARSLAECLRIQARDQGVLDACLDAVLDHLDLLAKGDFQRLAELCGCDVSRVQDCLSTLRRFDPKPGASFAADLRPLRPPDLIISREARGWVVELNASTLPEVVVREDLLCDRMRREAFVAEALASARGLKRAIEQRNASTLAIAAEVVRRQSDFLASAVATLAPLSMKDVAEAVAVHESTVSRVTTGLTMETPRGVVELRALLCRGLPGGRAPVSVADVQARIRALVEAEPPTRPLSDERITKRLKAEGVAIERRTVAKYRGLMQIKNAACRRAILSDPR